ncbi:nucleotidyl transferase AbiEii/AbiGii toxin family protein [Cryobacterium glaciale]|uniref:Nucleotidyl transferase AbiEii/AbiGii toxin family protein n=2 Tax=Cryobacterium glaciale TaxID=1259145 RepID=A0A4R8UQU9_9MICO|nr:nucleotidyl transferase AbiEii/AbiGii toxin family protein [Cryobacterium glaciale]
MLTRIAASPYAGDFVLKGGVLLAAFALRRPTKDIDLEATGVSNDVVDVSIHEIAAIDLDDGIIFDADSIRAETIREGDEYQGIRVRLEGSIGRYHSVVGLDVSFGDPIWPAPQQVEVPRILEAEGVNPVKVLGYPLAMVIAEKTVTMMQRGEANTRWRDFADVIAISRHHIFTSGEVRAAMDAVADHRKIELSPVAAALAGMPVVGQSKWGRWHGDQANADDLPAYFAEVVAEVAHFIDPLIQGIEPERNWEPITGTWT